MPKKGSGLEHILALTHITNILISYSSSDPYVSTKLHEKLAFYSVYLVLFPNVF